MEQNLDSLFEYPSVSTIGLISPKAILYLIDDTHDIDSSLLGGIISVFQLQFHISINNKRVIVT